MQDLTQYCFSTQKSMNARPDPGDSGDPGDSAGGVGAGEPVDTCGQAGTDFAQKSRVENLSIKKYSLGDRPSI